MTITLEEYADRYPDRPRPIPTAYAGQWIAWDASRQEIVAHGQDMSQIRREAMAAGHPEPILQKVPRSPFIGGA